MKCTKCGVELPDGSQFCNACGTKLDTNLKCTKCGADVPKDSQFCNSCGTKVAVHISQSKDIPRNEPIKPVQPTSVKDNTTKKSILSLRNIVLAIVGIFVIIIVLGVLSAVIAGFNEGITPVTITGLNLNIDYTSTSGYFGPPSQALSTSQFTTHEGGTFTNTITFESSALLFSHTVNSFSITTPGFTLVSVTPNVPSNSISPGSSEAFTLTIQAPNNAYNGPLNILASTS